MPKLNEQINKIITPLRPILLVVILLLCLPRFSPCGEYSRENAVVKAVRRVSPAVVNINSEYTVRDRANPFSSFGSDPFFDSFFKDFFDPGFEREYKRTSLGSGVIIDGKKGYILTNAHVIEKTGTIKVVLKDEREFEARILGADPDSDLAVLRIHSKTPLPAIEMGCCDDLMIGETVIAIGNPFGFSNTVTTGVISAVSRNIKTEDRVYHNFIQTDASINPGNSGGPLLNIKGELIGINTAIYAKAQGIGFAIPIQKAKRIISDLIRYGKVIDAWTGILVQDLDPGLARYLKIPEKKGVMVKEIEQGSPAQRVGVREGDILLSVGSKKIQSSRDYHAAMKNYTAGDAVKIHAWRNDKELTFFVKATAYPLELAMELAYDLLGIRVEDLSYKTRPKKGVIVSEINRQSYLARIGVRPGDIILQLNDMTIKNTKDFEKAIIKYRQKKSLVVLLQRRGQGYYITVKL